jgi:hypothetical protein
MKFNKKTKELTFDADEIFVINTENRNLPFTSANKIPSFNVRSWKQFATVMMDALDLNPKASDTVKKKFENKKLIFVDSFTRLLYWLSKELKAQGCSGHSFWKEYGDMIAELAMERKPNGKFLVYSAIDETISDGDVIDKKVVSVAGRMKGMVESYFDVVMATHFNSMKPRPECYQFETNTANGKTSAKSPVDMFKDIYIQNNLAYVLGSIYEYRDMANNPEVNPDTVLLVGKSSSGKSASLMYCVNKD